MGSANKVFTFRQQESVKIYRDNAVNAECSHLP